MHFYDAYKYGLTRKEQCGSGTIFLSFSHGGEGLGEEEFRSIGFGYNII